MTLRRGYKCTYKEVLTLLNFKIYVLDGFHIIYTRVKLYLVPNRPFINYTGLVLLGCATIQNQTGYQLDMNQKFENLICTGPSNTISVSVWY